MDVDMDDVYFCDELLLITDAKSVRVRDRDRYFVVLAFYHFRYCVVGLL
jgi:hypothetical protein